MKPLLPRLACSHVPVRLFSLTSHRDKPRKIKPSYVARLPPLDPRDITERLVGGSGGPGGTARDHGSNAVQLKHLPTGIVVKNCESRDVLHNRQAAHLTLLEQVDRKLRGPDSVVETDQRELSAVNAYHKALAARRRLHKKLLGDSQADAPGEASEAAWRRVDEQLPPPPVPETLRRAMPNRQTRKVASDADQWQ